ncbi:MAG: fatty acid CoA ligase family protein [Thermodesulfobacteriota bacterium]|nr:fatty acid CoA ligase family protein [Thermodesulfobacteriota bacterium]
MIKSHNIAQTLADVAARAPDRTALICRSLTGYRKWTFAEFADYADGYGQALMDKGVGKGDRVMLMVKPSMEFVCLTFALFRIGAVVILIDPGMGYKNLLKCIGTVRPQVFIGIPKAHLFRKFFPAPFKTVCRFFCVGPSFGVFGSRLLPQKSTAASSCVISKVDDPAAIIFTTGSTGPPKGVCYSHGIFHAQLRLIRDYYQIGPTDIDLPAFPLFALFSTALGACAVIPDMNPAQPAKVNPEKFLKTILDQRVTYSFGSPAIWNVVSRYCLDHHQKLPVKKILMAGAPISGELIERLKKIMPDDGEIHTPYGATESLPITSMTGSEILAETWNLTRKGKGTCVGRPLPGIDIRIIHTSDDPIPLWEDRLEVEVGVIGEIVVKGPVVTRSYADNQRENRLAKIEDGNGFWHRVGDVGYFDEQGRLWFCGRKGHRVRTAGATMYTICCEAIFNEHPQVYRSALVGIGESGSHVPVIIVEPFARIHDEKKLLSELRTLGLQNSLTAGIDYFLIHPSFPVDIRHNAKIFREKLAVWAAEQVSVSEDRSQKPEVRSRKREE